MLFSIGAGHQVVAVDSDSTLPASAPRTTLSGLTPNVEAIANYHHRPRGHLLQPERSRCRPRTTAHRRDSYRTPRRSLKDTYGQLAVLGRATGHAGSAQSLIASMRRQLATIVAAKPHFAKPVTYYYELDQTYYR